MDDTAAGRGGYLLESVSPRAKIWDPTLLTPGNEMFPTFRRNGELYFSPTDIPAWEDSISSAQLRQATPPERSNMRAPLNSQYDDFGMTFEGDYTADSSPRAGRRRGRDHIWTFELPETVHNDWLGL